MEKETVRCPKCKSSDVIKRGSTQGGHTKYQCKSRGCGKYFSSSKVYRKTDGIIEDGNRREVSALVRTRIRNEKQLISQCEIDTDEWEIERWMCNVWEMPSEYGAEPLFQVKAFLKRRVNEVRASHAIRDMKKDALKYAPKYRKIRYVRHKGDLLYEIDMPDLHFGKLAWAEETGQDYDIKIAEEVARNAFDDLLGYAKGLPIGRILLPLGNDFFNVNSALETTVNGTRQTEDTRWQKTFRRGRQLLVSLVETCSAVAPVDVLIIPGNHDRERMFYMGDALECWFHKSPNVRVNNMARLRKFYEYGANMIMFTHGSEEKFPELPGIMANEEPAMWGRTKFREAHVADRHHKEVLIQNVKELRGVTIRLLRSLTPLDDWHYRTGWLGALQAAESYLFHPDKGVIGQFTAPSRMV